MHYSYKVYPLSEWPDLHADWINNFLTVEKFAEHYNMAMWYAKALIAQGTFTDNFSKNN